MGDECSCVEWSDRRRVVMMDGDGCKGRRAAKNRAKGKKEKTDKRRPKGQRIRQTDRQQRAATPIAAQQQQCSTPMGRGNGGEDTQKRGSEDEWRGRGGEGQMTDTRVAAQQAAMMDDSLQSSDRPVIDRVAMTASAKGERDEGR